MSHPPPPDPQPSLLPTSTSPKPQPPSSSSAPSSPPSPLLSHLRTPVHDAYTSLPLLLCYFTSGLFDAGSYNAYATFISMQTGNTIFLALGASQQPLGRPSAWLNSLVSIAAFCAGCVAFARAMRALGPTRRGTLALSFALQGAFAVVAAALVAAAEEVTPEPRGRRLAPADDFVPSGDGGRGRFVPLAPIALLAFQAGGQIVCSRMLGVNELPTTVLTSVYCDLWSDQRVFGVGNRKRDRRVAGVVCLVLGGIAGGWISRSGGGLSAVLFFGAGLKVLGAVGWVGWKGEKGEGER